MLLVASAMPFAYAAPPAGSTAADVGQIANDIVSAGRLRMQSQRLAKL